MQAAQSSDPGAAICRLIRAHGPISVAQYMGESNARYYAARDPLGEQGDFLTAPEVSQMFGELIGLWCVDAWKRAGSPEPVHYVELGPGRATLAQDAARAAAAHGLKLAPHFIEGSPALRRIQHAAFPDAVHHHDVASLPTNGALLIVANEFFDALAIRQLLKTQQGWRERMVGLESGTLAFVAGDTPMDAAIPEQWHDAPPGTIIEVCPGGSAVMAELAQRLVRQGGAGLVIDYGSAKRAAGSTLQAIARHKKIDPLARPCAADLTAHVDFETLGDVALKHGVRLLGVREQGAWLQAMGLELRADALARHDPAQSAVIARQLHRLVSPAEMGTLFKVMGIAAPSWDSSGAGFVSQGEGR